MAVTPPSNRIWWKEPVHKVEMIWVIVAFLWGLTMFFTMIWWHAVGKQNLSNEAYRIQPAQYAAKVTRMIAASHKVRRGRRASRSSSPPPGSDVYLMGGVWQWWPMLELEKGRPTGCTSPRSTWQHGFSLQPVNINIQVHPGYEMVVNDHADDVAANSASSATSSAGSAITR